jgi:hypothetical protein
MLRTRGPQSGVRIALLRNLGAYTIAATMSKPNTHVRWIILALLLIASSVAYVLRTNMSIASEKRTTALGIPTVPFGMDEAPPGPLKIVMDARDLKSVDKSFATAAIFFTMMYILLVRPSLRP